MAEKIKRKKKNPELIWSPFVADVEEFEQVANKNPPSAGAKVRGAFWGFAPNYRVICLHFARPVGGQQPFIRLGYNLLLDKWITAPRCMLMSAAL